MKFDIKQKLALIWAINRMNYPSKIKENNYGKCLIASKNLDSGIKIAKFEGRKIKYNRNDDKPTPDEIPTEKVNRFIIINEDFFIIAYSSAQFINHSCDPNCVINDEMEVVTTKPVKNGEELTISYNIIDKKWSNAIWDDRWNFKCLCGSPICQGIINKYVYQENGKWIQIGSIWTKKTSGGL